MISSRSADSAVMLEDRWHCHPSELLFDLATYCNPIQWILFTMSLIWRDSFACKNSSAIWVLQRVHLTIWVHLAVLSVSLSDRKRKLSFWNSEPLSNPKGSIDFTTFLWCDEQWSEHRAQCAFSGVQSRYRACARSIHRLLLIDPQLIESSNWIPVTTRSATSKSYNLALFIN